MRWIVGLSLRFRWLVLFAAAALIVFGIEYNALDVRSLDGLELGGHVMACRLVVIAR